MQIHEEQPEEEEEEQEAKMSYQIFGVQRAGAGKWASCIRVLDPVEGDTKQVCTPCCRLICEYLYRAH